MKKSPTAQKFNLEATVTAKIIEALENGTRPWERPWTGSDADGLPLNSSGRAYRGVNIFMLWLTQMEKGYTSRYWFTMNQANALEAKIRKGEKSTMVVFAKKMTKEVEDKTAPDGKKKITWFYNRYYLVWNADQIDGLPEKFTSPAVVDNSDNARLQRIEHAEKFFAATGAEVRHGGVRAFFRPSEDFIQMPEFNTFRTAESYYAVLGHEHIHWSGAEKRLNRKFGNRLMDEETYAQEELVAEIGAAILCAALGIASDIREDHASYVASWLKALKNDTKLIFVAASKAQRAVDYLVKFSEPVEAVDAGDEEQDIEMQEAA